MTIDDILKEIDVATNAYLDTLVTYLETLPNSVIAVEFDAVSDRTTVEAFLIRKAIEDFVNDVDSKRNCMLDKALRYVDDNEELRRLSFRQNA